MQHISGYKMNRAFLSQNEPNQHYMDSKRKDSGFSTTRKHVGPNAIEVFRRKELSNARGKKFNTTILEVRLVKLP